MNSAPENRQNRALRTPRRTHTRGYTMLETVIVLLIASVLTAIAVPQVGSAMNRYRLQGAVANCTWAVQSTRYQALRDGIQYQVVFTKSTNSYQIQSSADGGVTFTNVANSTAIPLAAVNTVLNQDTTLRFKPNGYVSAPVGALNFNITYNGMCQAVTVTNYANITLSTIGPSCS